MPKIGYLGPEGSFSEEALLYWLENVARSLFTEKVEIIPYRSIPRLFAACDRQDIDWAFVPIENSIDGQVGVTLDCLNQSNLLIFREYIHPIDQCLLSINPIPLEDIKQVYSHEQALGQCRDFLETYLPDAQQIPCSSTAEAALSLASRPEPCAAIATRRAAQLYNLCILKESIQDQTANSTRFILVGQRLADLSDNDKTSLLIIPTNTNSPGLLSSILQEFTKRQINLTHIQSRPSKQMIGEYIFFIDLDGYVFSSPVQEALWGLKNLNVQVKLLGSYPKYDFFQPNTLE